MLLPRAKPVWPLATVAATPARAAPVAGLQPQMPELAGGLGPASWPGSVWGMNYMLLKQVQNVYILFIYAFISVSICYLYVVYKR